MAAHVAAGRLLGLVTLVASGDDVHIDTIGTPSFVDETPLKRDAIFRKFTRLEQTRTRTEGLGLGLAISRQIVELHGGSLTAGDRPDGKQGALFRVRIPRGLPGAR